jgi:Arc/MetJ family transcription regulator
MDCTALPPDNIRKSTRFERRAREGSGFLAGGFEVTGKVKRAAALGALFFGGASVLSLADWSISRLKRFLPHKSRELVWLILQYNHGSFRCMKKTLHIDEKTLREAREACGASTDTDTVRLGLEALIRQAAYQRLRRLRGSEKRVAEVPRRRETGRRGETR